jgi:co-chaperonin GroES (HSP10)
MPKGVIITDHRRKHRKEADQQKPIVPRNHMVETKDGPEFLPYVPEHAPINAMVQADIRRFTQEELMDLVAARFRPGPKRFLIVEDFPPTQIGRIIVPKKSQRPSTSGRVCAVGDGVVDSEGKSLGIKIGDHIVYAIFAGTLLPLSDVERVRAMQGSEIMCWVNDQAPDTLKLEGEVE